MKQMKQAQVEPASSESFGRRPFPSEGRLEEITLFSKDTRVRVRGMNNAVLDRANIGNLSTTNPLNRRFSPRKVTAEPVNIVETSHFLATRAHDNNIDIFIYHILSFSVEIFICHGTTDHM